MPTPSPHNDKGEALRQRIIAAATALFEEAGYAAVSMRKIAGRVGYSVGNLYLYYRDKDELFLAVQDAAFTRAFAAIQQLPPAASPRERLTALGENYVRFGLANPGLYRLMFMMDGPMMALAKPKDWGAGRQLHGLLTELVHENIAAGQVRASDPEVLSLMLWSCVHGMVSLRIAHRLSIYEVDDGHPQPEGATDDFLFATHQLIISLLAPPSGNDSATPHTHPTP